MKTTITNESICNAISTAWEVAREFEDDKNWRLAKSMWADIRSELEGMWKLCLWSPGSSEETRQTIDELKRMAEYRARIASQKWYKEI